MTGDRISTDEGDQVIALSWSGGKDSALALAELRAEGRAPSLLLSTVDERTGRTTHHGTRRELLRAQAAAAGLPLVEIEVPGPGSGSSYAERMQDAFSKEPLSDMTTVAFGDLFLEELRRFREERLGTIGVETCFPLWGRDTAELARRVAAHDYEAVIVSIDPAQLSPSYLGRKLDPQLLADLPTSVDPCGEHGEFHTFVRACPEFTEPIAIRPGDRFERHGFPHLELLLD